MTPIRDEHNGKSKWTVETLKEMYDRVISEIEKRYAEKFESAKSAVDAAFASSEKAIAKSDEALKEYKANANEFRASLDDARNNMVTIKDARNTEATFRAIIDGERKETEGLVATLNAKIEGHAKLISGLQISEGRGEGKEATKNRYTMTTIAIVGLLLTCLTLLAGLIYTLMRVHP